MSYGKEILIEQMIDEELLYQRACSMAQKGLWQTKDGQLLQVSKMTDKHIANCLSMLQRNFNPYTEPFIQMFVKEQEKRISNLKF